MATFHQMPDRTGLGVAPEQIVAIIESINAPLVSSGERSITNGSASSRIRPNSAHRWNELA